MAFAALFTACSSSKQQQRTPKSDVADMAALQNKRWVLNRLPDTSFKAPEKDIYIQFQENNTSITGFAGCNSYSGVFIAGARTMTFNNVVSTKMFCDNMPLENRMMHVLNTTNAYLITGETLQLLHDDKPLAWFTAVYLK
jgi:heat shock protein HslJ